MIHLLPLWEALEPELRAAKLYDCFAERMEFAPRLNAIKMVGVPIDVLNVKATASKPSGSFRSRRNRYEPPFPISCFHCQNRGARNQSGLKRDARPRTSLHRCRRWNR